MLARVHAAPGFRGATHPEEAVTSMSDPTNQPGSGQPGEQGWAAPDPAQQGGGYQQPQPGYDPNAYQQPQQGYVPQAQPGIPPGYQPKSRMTAGILGILLGTFGVHNFYLGKTSTAVIQLILGLTCFFAFVSSIWGLIEGILILTKNESFLTDGDGVPLVD